MRGKRLLKQCPIKAHELAEVALKKLGINIHYGCPMDPSKDSQPIPGGTGNYVKVIDCVGFKFVGPKHFMTGDLAACLDKRSG